jgi:leucyl aminopeptidase
MPIRGYFENRTNRMSSQITLSVQDIASQSKDTLVVFVAGDLKLPSVLDTKPGLQAVVKRHADIAKFTGKHLSSLTILAAPEAGVDKLILVGTAQDKSEAGKGKAKTKTAPDQKLDPQALAMLGGAVAGSIGQGPAVLVGAIGTRMLAPDELAELGLGALLRGYNFDRYKTKQKSDDGLQKPAKLTLLAQDAAATRKALKTRQAVADGVILARDLVNEPPNILTPKAFADRATGLKAAGVKVTVLNAAALAKLKMQALLGVGLGSANESYVVVMEWQGGKAGEAPVAFVGKGVTFDTGGISIKPAGGMEDMKGDMAGAACVTGLMHALASRKAKVNAIGIIGLVENMPDGKAQRPGDIVTSMSGQTIEIINTDAEGRLVLADILWHMQSKYKPKFMVNLATLTGAIMVALGQEHAGLFSNNDTLANRLTESGMATGELVWRMPLSAAYDKIMDSKVADMKNAGGRYAGSITAAQFLQRFVNGCPWAHLDIAGTAMGSPHSEINKSWSSGWGVRLLDHMVATHYET